METPAKDNQRQAVLAYCAGLIDGEGCISIDRHKPKPGQMYPYYKAGIAVSMCDTQGVQLLSETFGGVVWKQSGRGARRRDVYRWAVGGKDRPLHILLQLYPYLRVKRRHAANALDFILNDDVRQGRNTMTPVRLAWREERYQYGKQLNAGQAAATTKCESIREGEAIV